MIYTHPSTRGVHVRASVEALAIAQSPTEMRSN